MHPHLRMLLSWQSIRYIHAVALLVLKCESDRDSTHACHHEAVTRAAACGLSGWSCNV